MLAESFCEVRDSIHQLLFCNIILAHFYHVLINSIFTVPVIALSKPGKL